MAQPPQFCATAHPEDVLPCLSEAYSRRDTLAYGRLLASDYAAYYWDDPTPISTRRIELAAAQGFFNPDTFKGLTLTSPSGRVIRPTSGSSATSAKF
jgi:hypothetical protein